MSTVDTKDFKDVWLVKVPKYVASAWKEAPEGFELGKLQIQPGGPNKFVTNQNLDKLIKNDSSQTNKQLPSEYKLTLQPPTHQKLVILSRTKDPTTTDNNTNNNNGEKISFEGDVKFRGELRTTGDTSYMNQKSNLIKEQAKPVRVTQILEGPVTSYKPRGKAQLAHEADLRKKKEESKRMVREDKEIVQARLFAAFEKQRYYNIKELVKITNQSMPYLREILKEMCSYCVGGANKNMYELKPEYRHYKASSSK